MTQFFNRPAVAPQRQQPAALLSCCAATRGGAAPTVQVARTKAAYDRMLFREALKSGM